MRSVMKLMALGLCVTAGGCAVKSAPPATQQTDVPVRESFARSVDGAPAAPVADQWLLTFSDPALPALVSEALSKNSDLRESAGRRDEAQARARQSGAALVPTLDGNVGGQAGTNVGNPGNSRANLGLAVSWEIDVWGRVRQGVRAANSDALSAQADYEFARQSLAAQVAQSWFLAIASAMQIEIDREQVAVQTETHRITKAKFDAGAAGPMDTDIARANVVTAEDGLRQSTLSHENAVRSLEVLLGRYPSAELAVAKDLPAMPAPTPAGMPSELIARRPDLVAADRAVAAAFYRTGSAKAAQLPSFTLSASLGQLIDPSAGIWNIGGNMVAPLFDGGRRKEDVKITEARQEQALARYVKTALNAFKETETALSNEQVLVDRQRLVAESVARLTEARAAAQTRYTNGIMTLLELNQVQRQQLVAMSELLKVRSERLKQRINLHLALGGSFDQTPTTQGSGLNSPDTRSAP
jgi:outer membrane protein, multidrug efflux system